MKNAASNSSVRGSTYTKSNSNSASNSSAKKMASEAATNLKMLRSYASTMDSLHQSFVKASLKNSKTGQIGADYKKVAGMYKNMRTELQKMLNGERGPITNKLLNTSLSMLEKYKAKLIEVQTLQRNVLSGSTSGSMTTPLTQESNKPSIFNIQKYLSKMQSMYTDVGKQLSGFLSSNRLYDSDTIDSVITRARNLQNSLGLTMDNALNTGKLDVRSLLANTKQFTSFQRDMASISKQNL